ncbi:MAG: hypothetical protein DMD59_01235 [Gemmatimonadetes bacterium]|nr:MAG: hypothetical protein DMD59_01235 [Gemmatimonadota bacterium]
MIGVVGLLAASSGAAQDMPNPQAMQMQVQQIMQQRPREAEAAARAFLMLVAPERVNGLDSLREQATAGQTQPIIVVDGVPVSSPPSQDQYWMEVAQLTVQFDMVQKLNRRDSVRAQLVGKMFGLEANARAQQRAYRIASESRRPAIRNQIETLISQHFDLEDQLRALEVADIERRLADVRAESQRRREKRAEFIKFAVDDIVRDAVRPR